MVSTEKNELDISTYKTTNNIKVYERGIREIMIVMKRKINREITERNINLTIIALEYTSAVNSKLWN